MQNRFLLVTIYVAKFCRFAGIPSLHRLQMGQLSWWRIR